MFITEQTILVFDRKKSRGLQAAVNTCQEQEPLSSGVATSAMPLLLQRPLVHAPVSRPNANQVEVELARKRKELKDNIAG